MLEGCGLIGYMYSGDTRQQLQYCIACICAQTSVHHLSHLTLQTVCKPIGIEEVLGIS